MKTVYVLGAGASAGYQHSYIGETSPVSKNFFQKAFRVVDIHDIKNRHFADEKYSYKNLFAFIKQFWGIDASEIASAHADIDMEEVLTLLHIELEEHPHSETLKKACQEYMVLMALTFDKILYGDPCPYHQKIADSLSPGDVIISFNYELLMDNALLSQKNWSPVEGYGIGCHLLSNKDLLTRYTPSQVKLLKLHGSLNWLYCRKCHQLFIAVEPYNNKLIFVFNHSEKVVCSHMDCRHPLQPIIIPPTMMKNYDSMPFTQKLWRLAMSVLADADYIVVIGYSFPPTDFRTKWLFRKAMHQSKKTRQVTLVNHATGEKLQRLLQQYRSLMRTDKVDSCATIAEYTKRL